MNESTICLKAVSELLTNEKGASAHYWIPAYQRGYRWLPHQVKQLLDDLWEWEIKNRLKKTDGDRFYCLQPLVIKPDGDRYEVVDGQQRLTTILLILSHFNRRLMPEERKPLFSLTFETRPAFDQFLDDPSEAQARRNVDFFHLHQAILQIRDWFREHPHSTGDLESALLNRTKVIWFELAGNDNPVDAFTRLNVGKIPLTDDELIRALFLRQGRGSEAENLTRQLKIANEWDQIEKALQDNAFWYFLTDKEDRPQNRIGFLFELIARSEGIPPEAEHDKNQIFYAFSRKMEGADPDDEWLKIKEEFVRLQEWYEDETRILYHIVGFLVTQGVPLAEVRKLALDCTKSDLDRRLRQRVYSCVIEEWPFAGLSEVELRAAVVETVQALEYGSPAANARIRSLLLLFNIATLLLNRRSNLRFQFNSYKKEDWDLEHVRSVSPDRLKSYDERLAWMKACLGYLELSRLHPKLQAEIKGFIDLPRRAALETDFAELYGKVLRKVDEAAEEEADNGLGNLTLLDYRTNRSYKNAPFVVKRQKLLALDEAGTFVPLCTRNVFLKCYSPLVKNPTVWSGEDRQGYEGAVVETLVKFFLGRTEDAP